MFAEEGRGRSALAMRLDFRKSRLFLASVEAGAKDKTHGAT
jgi:hypothetical protein